MNHLIAELDKLMAQETLSDEALLRKGELLRTIRSNMSAVSNGEMMSYDPAVFDAPIEYTQEELSTLLGEEFDPTNPDHQEQVQEYLNADPVTEYQMENILYVLRENHTLVKWEDFANRERITESKPRACLAAFINMDGRVNIRSIRIRLFMPNDRNPITDLDTAALYDIPLVPQELYDQYHMAYRGEEYHIDCACAEWQREQIWARFRDYCDRPRHHALPIFSSTESRLNKELNYVDVRIAPITTALNLLSMDGTDQAKGKFSYMNTLFTTAAEYEGIADYRLVAHVALTPSEFSRLTRLLGLGPYVGPTGEAIGDGYGLAFPIHYDAEKIQNQVMHLTGEIIDENEALRRAKFLNQKNMRDYQFRWAWLKEDRTGAKDGEEGLWTVGALAKGTLLPMDRASARQKVKDFQDFIASEPYDPTIQPWAETVELLDSILANNQVEVVVLVKGDQIKMGKEEVPTACQSAEGLSFLVGTHLVGAVPDDNPTPETHKSPLQAPAHQFLGYAKQHVSSTLLEAEAKYPDQPLGLHFAQNTIPVALEELEITYLDGVAHVVTPGQKAWSKPLGFSIQGSSQQIMFLSGDATVDLLRHMNRQVELLAHKCRTPAGIAALVHEAAVRDRQILEHRQGELDAGKVLQPLSIDRKSGDLLNTAIRSNLIRLTPDGYNHWITNGMPEVGELQMPMPIWRTLNRFIGHKAKSLLRTFGTQYAGYLNHTCESSLARFVDLNSNWGPFLSPGVLFLPREVTKHLNADDDGDILSGMAAEVAIGEERIYFDTVGRRRFLNTERLALVTLVTRYPQVDAPVLWVAPIQTPSPFRARNAEDEEAYRSFIEIYRPRTNHPLNNDDIVVLNTTERLVKIQDAGVTEKIDARPITGPPTLDNMIDMVQRKASLNQTGLRTRDLERLLVIRDEIQRKINKDPVGTVHLRPELDDCLLRIAAIQDSIEMELKALKKDVDASGRVRLDFPNEPLIKYDKDGNAYNVGMDTDKAVREMIPLDYHNDLRSVDRIVHGEHESTGKSIESLVFHGIGGLGKETAVLNLMLKGFAPMPEISGAGIELVQTFKGIRTELAPWLGDLTKQINNATITDAHRAEADKLSAMLQLWRETWRDVLNPDSEIPLTEEEREKLSTSRISSQLRHLMGHYGADASREALMLAIQADWQAKSTGDNQNVTGSLALLGSRIGEVFPLGAAMVRVERKTHGLEVFTRHHSSDSEFDLPGYIGLQIKAKVTYIAEKDMFILSHEGRKWPLYLASGQYDKRPTAKDDVHFIKVRRRTAYLHW